MITLNQKDTGYRQIVRTITPMSDGRRKRTRIFAPYGRMATAAHLLSPNSIFATYKVMSGCFRSRCNMILQNRY